METLNFDNIFKEHKDLVFSKVYLTLGSFEEAEEVTQDIFVKIYFWLKNFQWKSSIKTWIFSITRNTCYDFIRSKKEDTIPIDDINEVSFPEKDDIISKIESADTIETVFKTLKPIEKLLIMMKYGDEMSIEDISKTIQKTFSYTKKIIYVSRKKFITNYKKIYETKNI